VPRGAVISTEPSAGTKIVDGGQLDAVVSRGPERHPMPAVVGLTRSAATAALTGAELRASTVTEAWSRTVPAGEVVKASVAPGAGLKPGTEVTLTVSKGPKPLRVPDQTGEPVDAAAQALRKAGFRVALTSENSTDVPEGRVLRQSPEGGTGQKGDTITLTRSLGPVLVTVPNVTAMGVQAAEQVLAEAGFKTEVDADAGSYLGFVLSTGPKARTEAPRGSTITLHVV
jgi:beta-lactam-binding protein with PASTA domain